MNPLMPIHYQPRLMEEAVFHAQRKTAPSAEYKKARNRIYEIADRDERDRRFDELNQAWFTRFHLDRPIADAIAEQPLIGRHIGRCFVAAAGEAKQEGAELFVAEGAGREADARRTLRILLRPESLLEPGSLVPFLRHELLHITDMLDPLFGYEPALPAAEGGPTYDTLITSRYRVLWDVTIDGRMVQRGWCAAATRERDFRDFVAAFPMLGAAAPEVFQRFFDAAQPRHSELAAFALDPRAGAGHGAGQIAAGTHCALCRFPTHAFEPAPERLAVEVVEAILGDFPDWTPAHGLCLQCADLYRARRLSLSAARHLPGWEPEIEPDTLALQDSRAGRFRERVLSPGDS